MQSTTDNLKEHKVKIMNFIKTRGPTFPVRISENLKLDSLIVSAFLSELLSDKQLRLSNLRVGNSPLYYIPGQEFQLEKFSNYLKGKEREAFELLRQKGVLEDRQMLPPIRVALRSIKDFSFPLEHNGKLYWRFNKISDQRAIELVSKGGIESELKLRPVEITPIVKPVEMVERGLEFRPQEQVVKPIGIQIEQKQTDVIEHKKVEESDKPFENVSKPEENKPFENVSKPIKPKLKRGEKSEFVLEVEQFLRDKQFRISEEVGFKKKEYFSKIRIGSQIGSLDFLCIAKDKKSVNENDLNLALQKSQDEKMPVLLICKGEMNKRAVKKFQELENLIFYKLLE